MDKKDNIKKSKERINQFIIECIFSKYFEGQDNKIVVKKEEIASPRGFGARNDGVLQRTQ